MGNGTSKAQKPDYESGEPMSAVPRRILNSTQSNNSSDSSNDSKEGGKLQSDESKSEYSGSFTEYDNTKEQNSETPTRFGEGVNFKPNKNNNNNPDKAKQRVSPKSFIINNDTFLPALPLTENNIKTLVPTKTNEFQVSEKVQSISKSVKDMIEPHINKVSKILNFDSTEMELCNKSVDYFLQILYNKRFIDTVENRNNLQKFLNSKLDTEFEKQQIAMVFDENF